MFPSTIQRHQRTGPYDSRMSRLSVGFWFMNDPKGTKKGLVQQESTTSLLCVSFFRHLLDLHFLRKIPRHMPGREDICGPEKPPLKPGGSRQWPVTGVHNFKTPRTATGFSKCSCYRQQHNSATEPGHLKSWRYNVDTLLYMNETWLDTFLDIQQTMSVYYYTQDYTIYTCISRIHCLRTWMEHATVTPQKIYHNWFFW